MAMSARAKASPKPTPTPTPTLTPTPWPYPEAGPGPGLAPAGFFAGDSTQAARLPERIERVGGWAIACRPAAAHQRESL